MKRISLTFILILICGNIFSQINYLEGKEFWFGFMANMSTPNSDVAITSNNGTNGVIRIPASNWTQSFIVPPNGSIEISLPLSLTQIDQSGTFPFGVNIITDDTISVYLINRTDASDDATLIKPLKALGYKYYVSTWQEPEPMNDLSEYIVVSTHDQTVISITTSLGVTSTILLNEGEIYQFQSGTNLTSTLIESTCNIEGSSYPIAVFSGARATMIGTNGTRDHLVSQMHPVDSWGVSFNLIPLPYANNYFINIIARDAGTVVNLNGTNYNIGQGEFLTLNQIGFGYVLSNKPISIQMFTRGKDYIPSTNLDGDPLMINISPDNLGVLSTQFYSFDITATFVYPQTVQILTSTQNIGNILLDGITVSGWNVNPLNPLFSYSEINLPQGATNHSIISTDQPFIAYPSAQLHARSYGYCIGHNTPFYEPEYQIGYLNDTLNYMLFTDTICSCEPVWFNASYPDSSMSFSWDFGDSDTGTGNPVNHSFLNGNFDIKLILTNDNGCKLDSIIKYNLIVVNCDIEMNNLNPICLGDSIILSSVVGQEFIWNTGDTTSSIVVTPSQTTSYSLQVDGGLQNICEEIMVYVHEQPTTIMDDSITICSNDVMILSSEIIGDYLWSTGETSEEIVVNTNGIYSVTITDTNQCIINDSTVIIVSQLPLWLMGNDAFLCQGDSLELELIGGNVQEGDFLWSTSETSNSILVNDEGLYWFEFSDSICYTSDSIQIFEVHPWGGVFYDSISICKENYVLNFEQDYSNYLWSTGETTSQIIVEESGIYNVDIDNQCGTYAVSIAMVFDCSFEFYLPNSFTPNGDQINDNFKGVGRGITHYQLSIFNRWGELLFNSNDLNTGWNGINSVGQSEPAGTYSFMVEITDVTGEFKSYIGHVNLIR